MTSFRINARTLIALILCILFAGLLVARMIQINSYESQFLIKKGISQYGKLKDVPSKRGKIYDRNGHLLAISAEAYSIFVRPSVFKKNKRNWSKLEQYLGQPPGYVDRRISGKRLGDFAYLQPRLLAPHTVEKIMNLGLAGLGREMRYQRFYPQRDSIAHLIGYTNDDHTGQEGIELIFDDYLSGKSGKKRVFLDAKGREIASPHLVVPVVEGKDLYLTIDYRAQFYGNKILKESIKYHDADSGSLMIIDSSSGEIITMVNAPNFNPNSRSTFIAPHVRNRAITDPYEPGSTLKPFVIAAALENGVLQPLSKINTSPGLLKVGNWKIRDGRDHGVITVEQILEKSSNVGVAKISDKLTGDGFLTNLERFGFGEYTGAMLPGESIGEFPELERMSFLRKRSLSFGYGISVTTAQLARAYSVFANDGSILDLKISKHSTHRQARRVVSSKTSSQVFAMLRKAVEQGTGTQANITNFDVAGKTGTVRKASHAGYSEDEHTVFFAGILPTRSANYVCVVVVDRPRLNGSTGGKVAASIFSKLMEEIIRIFALEPLKINQLIEGEI